MKSRIELNKSQLTWSEKEYKKTVQLAMKLEEEKSGNTVYKS